MQRQRLALALVEDCPALTPMGRDERVTADRYNEQEPTRVVDQLAANADALAADVEACLDADQLDRTMIYNYPERQERTVLWRSGTRPTRATTTCSTSAARCGPPGVDSRQQTIGT